MNVLAHRGCDDTVPENTYPAFEEVLRSGFGIETDVRPTADGSLVLHHDRTLSRTAGVDATIGELTERELPSLQFDTRCGSEQYEIPTLEGLLELVGNRPRPMPDVALHLKCEQERTVEAVVETLERFDQRLEHDVLERTVVFDVTIDTAKITKRANEAVRVGFSIGDANYFPDSRYPTIYPLETVQGLDCWDVAWADEWCGSLYTNDFVEQVRAEDKTIICVSPELHVDTDPRHPNADSPAEVWQRLRRLQVDGVCTDYPISISKRNE